MNQMYTAKVILDSISPNGDRITTLRVVYPHAVHKDLLRHRCMNRNVESFRAQPPEILIKNLKEGHAFKPEAFAARAKGMGQGEDIDEIGQQAAQLIWQRHVDHCITTAEQLLELDLAKQQVNFPLQDICPLTEIITATDWGNFYALRTELNGDGTPVARPEVYLTAKAIQDAMAGSKPQELDWGKWHIPFTTDLADNDTIPYRVAVSAGRSARISYGDYQWWEEEPELGFERAQKLLLKGHMSPTEQQAMCWKHGRWNMVRSLQRQIEAVAEVLGEPTTRDMVRQLEYSGNLRGWMPARKMFVNEYDYGLLKTVA